MGAIGWFLLVIIVCSIGIYLQKTKKKREEAEVEAIMRKIKSTQKKEKKDEKMVSESQTPSVKIDRPVNVVWDYFITIGNWSKWYGGGVKKIAPTWQRGAEIVWELGGSSQIVEFKPFQEICLSGAWMDTTFEFMPEGNSVTIIKVIESAPKGGAYLTDGGAAQKAQCEKTLQKLKKIIEDETSA